MAKIKGGPGKPVQVIGDGDLIQNGGRYVVVGRNAIPVHGLNLGERKVVGGNAIRVYPVTAAQIQSGEYKLTSGASVSMYDVSRGGLKRTSISGRQAIPVYVTSGQALGVLTYTNKVLSIQPANLIAYWPLSETSGTNADNAEGTVIRDGTFIRDVSVMGTGVGVGDGKTAPDFDGTVDYTDIYSASLGTAFSKDKGTLAAWFKVSGVGVWTDAVWRYIVQLWADNSNYVLITKSNVNNQLVLRYRANSISNQVQIAISDTGWNHVAITWDTVADEVRVYLNGAQVGVTQTGLDVWAGSLSGNGTNISAATESPTLTYDGYIAHVPVWTIPLALADIQKLATV